MKATNSEVQRSGSFSLVKDFLSTFKHHYHFKDLFESIKFKHF